MSRRIAMKVGMTNRELVVGALKNAGYSYSESGNRINILSGPLSRASINLASGELEGDSDYHTSVEVDGLKQFYRESAVRADYAKNGGQMTERTVHQNGDIELIYQIG